MNLVEVKCQQCVFTSTAEDVVSLLRRSLVDVDGAKEAIAELRDTAAGAAVGENYDEVVLNGMTMSLYCKHLVAEPTHALTITLRSIEL